MAETSTPLQPGQPVSGIKNETNLDGKVEMEVEAQKDERRNSAHVQSQALREDQVLNAVKFLSHPSVRGSPIVHRRSFLEKKGLSKEEIDEAFHRVPDPPSNNFPGPVAAIEEKPFSLGRQNVTAPTSSAAVISTQQPLSQQLVPVVKARSRSYWSQTVVALSFLVAAGTGTGFFLKRFLLQKLKLWIQRVVLEDDATRILLPRKNLTEEAALAAAVAAQTASVAATEVANTSREMIKLHTEERNYLGSIIETLEAHTLELTKAMITVKLAMEAVGKSTQQAPAASAPLVQSNYKWHSPSPMGQKSMEGIQSAMKHSNQTVTRTGAHGYIDAVMRKEDTGLVSAVRPLEVPPSTRSDGAPHSASYLKVMEMLERGETPPGIQEINDKPPNPEQPPSISRLQPKQKPWETVTIENNNSLSKTRISSSRSIADRNTKYIPLQGDDASRQKISVSTESSDSGRGAVDVMPWWREKKAEPALYGLPSRSPETIGKSIDMEKLADGNINGMGSSSPSSSSSSQGEADLNGISVDGQVRRTGWVPPPFPPTVMPGAAAAIKYQKAGLQDEGKSSLSMHESVSIHMEEKPLHLSPRAVQNFPSVTPATNLEDMVLPVSQSFEHPQRNNQVSEKQPVEFSAHPPATQSDNMVIPVSQSFQHADRNSQGSDKQPGELPSHHSVPVMAPIEESGDVLIPVSQSFQHAEGIDKGSQEHPIELENMQIAPSKSYQHPVEENGIQLE